MHNISATCPLCQSTNFYGAELIGRYTLCTSCRGRFYIEVPPLGETKGRPLAGEPITCQPIQSMTLDDLLWDTQQGNRFIIQALWRMESQLKWHGGGIAALIAVVTALIVILAAG